MSTSQVAETLNLPTTVTVFPELCRGPRLAVLWHREKVFPALGQTEEPKGLLYPQNRPQA